MVGENLVLRISVKVFRTVQKLTIKIISRNFNITDNFKIWNNILLLFFKSSASVLVEGNIN